LFFTPEPIAAHGGGLDANGCHHDRKNGGYHCHRGPLSGQSFGSAAEASSKPKAEAPKPSNTVASPTTAAALPSAKPTTRAVSAVPVCGPLRANFERLVAARLQTYAATGDSWSPLASEWQQRIDGNLAKGKATEELDAAFGRYARYCSEGDGFMAGIAVGEWVGLALRPR
jgi:hypothetical protein